MTGKASPLWIWREGLPAERELRSAGLSRLAEWAYFVTPDFSRVRRVARLSLQLYDGFANCGLIARDANTEERSILHAAALLQEVGHFKKGKAHHKESYRMIRRIAPPPGWSKRDLELVALIARFHRRALPRPDHKILRTYEFPLRQSVILLAAILRFANAFHAKPYRASAAWKWRIVAGVIVVRAEGFPEQRSPRSQIVRRKTPYGICVAASRPHSRARHPDDVASNRAPGDTQRRRVSSDSSCARLRRRGELGPDYSRWRSRTRAAAKTAYHADPARW